MVHNIDIIYLDELSWLKKKKEEKSGKKPEIKCKNCDIKKIFYLNGGNEKNLTEVTE